MTLAFAGVCSAIPTGWAAESLHLEQAVARSLASNPTLAAETAELQAVEARAEREGLAPQFVVSSDLDSVAGTGSLNGLDSAELTLRLGRTIELGGKRAARQALGAAQTAQQRQAAAAARVDVSSLTASRFIEVVAAQERLALASEHVELAERIRREVAAWVAASRNPETDLHAAEIALADVELLRETVEHELASAKVTLAAAWGALEPDFGIAVGTLDELPAVEDFDILAARLPMSSTLRATAFQIDTLKAYRRVAESSTRPDIDVSLGVRRFEALNDQGLVMSFSVPLGSRPRASLAIAETNAQLAAVEARRDALQTESHQILFSIYQELMHARHEHEVLRANMLPKAERALNISRQGFEAGRLSFLALAQAQRTLFDLRKRSVDVAAEYHSLLVEVERLTAIAPEATP